MNKIKELLKKYEEVIKYLIIGVLTTIINYTVFAILSQLLRLDIHVSNIIAWIITVIVAYLANKLFVFESKSFKTDVLIKEVSTFGLARVFSLLLEEMILYVFVNLLKMNELIIKLIANIVVIIVNYIFSKFIIFKKQNEQK